MTTLTLGNICKFQNRKSRIKLDKYFVSLFFCLRHFLVLFRRFRFGVNIATSDQNVSLCVKFIDLSRLLSKLQEKTV